MALKPIDVNVNAVTIHNDEQTSVTVNDDGNRQPRLPRWTRQEILVLIQGKKEAENRVRIRRPASSNQVTEPKWATVSSYCKRHGVNRGPVQCRKRWSNLAGDFKKIKEWEVVKSSEDRESFWVMRNDLRRERKLPGFFDREVYDILDGGMDKVVGVLLDRSDGLAEDALSSDFEMSEEEGGGDQDKVTVAKDCLKSTVPAAAAAPLLNSGNPNMIDDVSNEDTEYAHFGDCDPVTSSEAMDFHLDDPVDLPHVSVQETRTSNRNSAGTTIEKKNASNQGSPSQEGRKRKRAPSEDGDMDLQGQLINVLEKSSILLTAQLEAQNMNCQLDRDQRKDQANNLVTVLSKLADALGRIADKL
ncbi:hypothetical protein IFM89_002960 [Coptis chinensis]|uniref:Myb-like domain-containing protein n=1 Tax=Coptis chinensis TaxID=261450 RepID=A0A835IHB6_9MAGN|nr:hypothetical protein IFM89_002960 [Coptis chinensis]